MYIMEIYLEMLSHLWECEDDTTLSQYMGMCELSKSPFLEQEIVYTSSHM